MPSEIVLDEGAERMADRGQGGLVGIGRIVEGWKGVRVAG